MQSDTEKVQDSAEETLPCPAMEKYVKGRKGKENREGGNMGQGIWPTTHSSAPFPVTLLTAAFWQVLPGCEKITFPVDRIAMWVRLGWGQGKTAIHTLMMCNSATLKRSSQQPISQPFDGIPPSGNSTLLSVNYLPSPSRQSPLLVPKLVHYLFRNFFKFTVSICHLLRARGAPAATQCYRCGDNSRA